MTENLVVFAEQPFPVQASIVAALTAALVVIVLTLVAFGPDIVRMCRDLFEPDHELDRVGLVRVRTGDEIVPTPFERYHGIVPLTPPVGSIVLRERVRRTAPGTVVHVADAADPDSIHRAIQNISRPRVERRKVEIEVIH